MGTKRAGAGAAAKAAAAAVAAGAAASTSQGRKLPVAKKLAVKIARSVARLMRVAAKIKGWSTTADGHLSTGIQELGRAQIQLEGLPDNFAPPRSQATIQLEPGSRVAIREKRRPGYVGDLSPAEMESLRVVELRKARVLCATSPAGAAAGIQILIPRGHLMLAPATVKEIAPGKTGTGA